MSRSPLARVIALAAFALLSACTNAPQASQTVAKTATVSAFLPASKPPAEWAAAKPAPPPPPPPRHLAPHPIRGVYVNSAAAGSASRLADLLALADSSEINTFVVDVKTGDGVRFPSGIALADSLAGRRGTTIAHPRALVDTLHAHHIYAIARIVTFKDPSLARARPDWSIRKPDGSSWVDKAGNRWVSAWDHHVWDYNLAIAEAAARDGFDAIQFDYVRFPEPYPSLGPQVHPRATGKRTDAIAAFLAAADRRLHPLGVQVAADVFGMSMDDATDVGIGQQWERLSAVVDQILPMVYPSHYMPTHLPGIHHPNRTPYETVRTAVGMGVIRNHRLRDAGADAARIIPWLQAFDAPWVDRDFPYRTEQARDQIRAVYDDGLDDWIFWNPSSHYAAVDRAFADSAVSHARKYEPPHSLVHRVDRYEGWGMRKSRERALQGEPPRMAARAAAPNPAASR